MIEPRGEGLPQAEASARSAAAADAGVDGGVVPPVVLPPVVARAIEGPAEAEEPLSDDELFYAERARAANTRRGYRSDLEDFTRWCRAEKRGALPATPATINAYLVAMVRAGAKIATMSRRLSSIAYAHRFAGHPNPVDSPRVHAAWEGIRREHPSALDQAPALMPPLLWEVLDALPANLVGRRDRALILVGFVGALRRSELAAMAVEHLVDDPRGLVLSIPTSKTDPRSEGQLVVLPYARRCPVTAVRGWLEEAEIQEGPVFRAVHRNGRSVRAGGMSEAAINNAIQRACVQALGDDGKTYSAHSLRAGFATYAAQNGASDRAIAHQTRHRSLASLDRYIRVESAWADNAATALDL